MARPGLWQDRTYQISINEAVYTTLLSDHVVLYYV